MSQVQNGDQSEPIDLSVKKMKRNNEVNNPSKRARIVANEQHQSGDIFKLVIDCFEEVFDFLSLQDLVAMGQTCKRMQRIAGHCFQQNYRAQPVFFCVHTFLMIDEDANLECFYYLLQNIEVDIHNIFDEDEDLYISTQNFITSLKHLQSIKKITIGNISLTMAQIDEMRLIRSKIESVKFEKNDFNEKLFNALLAPGSNVKHLSLRESFSNEHQWMYGIYPKLEYFELTSCVYEEVPALKTFFELNTTIKHFSIDMGLLWSNRAFFINSNIKFDTLRIIHRRDVEFDSFCRLLNEFHECGFYKKLRFGYMYDIEQETINQLASVKGLVMFGVDLKGHNINISSLINLEELCVSGRYDSNFIMDCTSLRDKFLKLKRIDFYGVSFDNLIPFIFFAKNVNKINVQNLRSGSHFEETDGVLDLLTLNKERKKLFAAQKITIYAEEHVYLATKWAMKQTDFKLIEMKRITSYDWRQDGFDP
ncbi:uncharacterized protein LOC116350393 [Contarinia nasturtii]|uniref:uncharacterized protein LOC116350393 n=1 Tax=Contarinia nasturtii TaxID=265458 RepID=UPI0012D499F3|nr:uncharacterized protein LOC116350393 [Contarinia nasturtii]